MKLIVQKDPQGILGREITTRNGCAFDAIIDAGGCAGNCVAYLNGKKLELPSEDSPGDEESLTKPLNNDDVVFVVLEPKGFDPVTLAIIAVVAAVVSLALVPEYDPNAETQNESTNNDLYGQTNSARLYQAIPDAYGEQVMFPDLATSEASRRYVGNEAQLQQLMVLGVGYYERGPIKLESTLLSQITGAVGTWYEPDPVTGITTIPEYEVQYSVQQVDGQELPGTEDVNITFGNTGTRAEWNSVDDIGTITVNEPGGSPLFNQYIVIGDTVDLSNCDITTTDIPNPPLFGNLNGSYVVTGVTERSISVANASVENINWLEVSTTTTFDRSDARAIRLGRETVIGPFDTSIAARGVLVEFILPRGLYDESRVLVEYEQIDEQGGSPVPGGISGSVEYVYSGETLNSQFRTENVVVAPSNVFWRVKVTRTNDASTDGARPNLTEWHRLASYNIEQNAEYPGVTMLLIDIPSSANSVSPRESEVNVEAERKVISYDTGTKTIDTTPAARGSRFADAVLHEYVNVFGRDSAELDLDEMYAIQESLDATDTRLGQFSTTFDDIDLSLGERIANICDTCRVTSWHDGIVYRFYRYEAKTPNGIITRRDLAAERNYNRTFQPRMPSDADSVKLEWVDPDDNKKAYVFRSYDAAGNILTEQGRNPINIQLNGCRNQYQADNRADVEIRRILYEREFLTDTVLSQGMLYDLGDVVKYADVYRDDVFNGEILSVSGLTAFTSEKFEPEVGKTYEVEYNDELGTSYGPYEIQIGPIDKSFTLAEGDFNNVYFAGSGIQLGSRYIISEVSAAEPDYFWITGKSPSNSDADLSMSQYDERVFEVDP